MRPRWLIPALVAVFLIASPLAWAQEDLGAILNKVNELYKAGNYEGTIAELKKALDILVTQKNDAGAQKIQMNIGINYVKLNKYEDAVRELEEAKGRFAKPDPKVDYQLNTTLATAHYQLGHYALRAKILEELLSRQKALEDEAKAELLAQLADAYRRGEIHFKAISAYQQSLALFKKMNNQPKQALILTAMGLSQVAVGDYTAAVATLTEAQGLAQTAGNAQNQAETQSNLGVALWNQGQYPKALETIAAARKIEADNSLKQNLGADYNNEGLVYKSVGNYLSALAGFEQSITIAREIGDKRSEAIALANRALVRRIQGKNAEALADYLAALKLYEAVGFKEGTANCLLGLGKLYEVHEKDYRKANDSYLKALAIFEELGNLAFQAETLNQIGRCLRASIDPAARASRDLVFEEDPPKTLEITPDEAKEKSLAAYQKALELAKTTGKKEAIWSAQQGIGFALRAQGKDEEAFPFYKEAVDTVMGMRAGGSDLMANYMNDKEDLFDQAIDLCTALFNKTQKEEYRRLMMEYQEIYKNEVMKVAMNGTPVQYQDVDKDSLFKKITQAMDEKAKLDEVAGTQKSGLAKAVDEQAKEAAEQKQRQVDLANENKTVVEKARKLDQTISQLLKEWKKKYPDDAPMFESSSQIDLKGVQKGLGPDRALIQYFPLSDKLSILVVTEKSIQGAEVKIGYKELSALIRDRFSDEVIEKYGHQKTDMTEEQAFDFANQTMNQLYKILIEPVAESIKDKKHLVIVPSKYVSYVPFSALVSGFEGKEPRFLVQDKTVSYIRLSFFSRLYAKKQKTAFDQNKLLAVGNPTHQDLKAGLPDLPGAEKEVQNAVAVAQEQKLKATDVMFREEASEKSWKEKAASGGYSIYYFATHGVPYAEIFQTRIKIGKVLERTKQKYEETKDEKLLEKIKGFEAFANFYDKTFMSKSPLNGFLYMTYAGEEGQDGILTLKEIMEMPEASFKSANLAILSACNTAVTYSPMVSPETRKNLETAEIDKELLAAGFTPGVDQVSLTDTFMRRKFKSVLGTLWFADDQATSFIIARFFENLAQNPPAEALRQAQLQYLEKPPMDDKYTKVPKHPYYWAVSAVFGE